MTYSCANQPRGPDLALLRQGFVIRPPHNAGQHGIGRNILHPPTAGERTSRGCEKRMRVLIRVLIRVSVLVLARELRGRVLGTLLVVRFAVRCICVLLVVGQLGQEAERGRC